MQEGVMSIDAANNRVNAATGDLYSLKIRDLWAFFKSQDILFWLINVYLFLEYVKPQALYPSLDVLPFSLIVILTTLALLFVTKKSAFVTNANNKLITLFTVIVLLSCAFAISPQIAFKNIYIYISWVLIYFLIINIVNTEDRFLLFVLMFLLYNFKMSQYALKGWARIGFSFGKDGTGGGPGWFENSGEFGIEMCIFLPLAVYFIIALKKQWPRWKRIVLTLLPITAVTGIISSSSRGAVVGGLAVMLWMLLKSRKRLVAAVLLFIIATFSYLILPDEQRNRFSTAGKDSSSLSRTERWEKGWEMAKRRPLFGVGYKNWAIADMEMFSGGGALCHNIFVECLSELGFSGMIAFVFMIICSFLNNYKTRKFLVIQNKKDCFAYYMAHGLDAAMIGFLVSGSFVTVLYYPYFWINISMSVALNNSVIRTKEILVS